MRVVAIWCLLCGVGLGQAGVDGTRELELRRQANELQVQQNTLLYWQMQQRAYADAVAARQRAYELQRQDEVREQEASRRRVEAVLSAPIVHPPAHPTVYVEVPSQELTARIKTLESLLETARTAIGARRNDITRMEYNHREFKDKLRKLVMEDASKEELLKALYE